MTAWKVIAPTHTSCLSEYDFLVSLYSHTANTAVLYLIEDIFNENYFTALVWSYLLE